MKKVLVSVIVASGMILGSTAVASAATQAPSIKKPPTAKNAEGTATHEMSETSTKQKSESALKIGKTKKTSKKKNALVTKKK